jgi:hypothetical protein
LEKAGSARRMPGDVGVISGEGVTCPHGSQDRNYRRIPTDRKVSGRRSDPTGDELKPSPGGREWGGTIQQCDIGAGIKICESRAR